jgi:hypothetical protein
MKAIWIIALVFLIASVSAAPGGTAVSLVGNNNATFSAASGEAEAWFEYGMTPETLVVWTAPVAAGGAYTWTEIGSPLTSGETYYVAGCDSTGCDTPASFTMLDATPLPVTTYGNLFTNGTRNKFNLLTMIPNIAAPYTWLFPASNQALAISILAGIVFFGIFFGLAMKTRYVAVPIIVGLIVAPYLLYASQGLGIGIPAEFRAVAQGLTYACFAGILLLILKK